MSILTDFFSNQAQHPSGSTLDDIIAWNDHQWERRHDFIQWVFPTRRASAFNEGAPRLTTEDIEAFRKDYDIQHSLNRIYERFSAFLCLEDEEMPWWFSPTNHNLLRITRALDSLKTLSTQGQEVELMRKLHQLIEQYPGQIPGRTVAFWEAAALGGS